MTVWNKLEPLLGEVRKPKRYIGCEDGVQASDHHPDAGAWLLTYPEGKDVNNDVWLHLSHLAVVGPTVNGIEIEANLATQPCGVHTFDSVRGAPPQRRGMPGMAQQPLDAARRRPVRVPSGIHRGDVGAARPSACVMRRDRTHDRNQHRRTPGRTHHQRI